MTPEALFSLAQAADALYQVRLAALQSVLAEEARLRRELADLDTHQKRNAELPAEDLAGLRAVGGDMLWQGWVERMRARLNVQLARVLVRKADQMDVLRQAFGRAEAAQALADTARQKRRTARQNRDMRQIDELVQLSIGRQTS